MGRLRYSDAPNLKPHLVAATVIYDRASTHVLDESSEHCCGHVFCFHFFAPQSTMYMTKEVSTTSIILQKLESLRIYINKNKRGLGSHSSNISPLIPSWGRGHTHHHTVHFRRISFQERTTCTLKNKRGKGTMHQNANFNVGQSHCSRWISTSICSTDIHMFMFRQINTTHRYLCMTYNNKWQH